jgi:hypothetical protein
MFRENPLEVVRNSQLGYAVAACEREVQTRCVMLLQVISVVGALMVLSAYGLLQGGIWRVLNAGYLAFNIVGSLLLGIVAIVDQRIGFIFLEFAWAGLGLIGVARAMKARQTS